MRLSRTVRTRPRLRRAGVGVLLTLPGFVGLPTLAGITTLAGLGTLSACAVPGEQVVDADGIIGTYTLNGVDANEFEYSGTVVIAAGDDADHVNVQWLITGAIHEGDGVIDGEVLTVTWRSLTTPRGDDAASTGTATYRLDDEGNLTGTKVIDGVSGSATETIFQKA